MLSEAQVQEIEKTYRLYAALNPSVGTLTDVAVEYRKQAPMILALLADWRAMREIVRAARSVDSVDFSGQSMTFWEFGR